LRAPAIARPSATAEIRHGALRRGAP
jgi:hypothetical protein